MIQDSNHIFQTQRLVLREANNSDAEFYFKLMNSEGWLQYIGDRNIHDVKSALLYIENKVISSYCLNGYGMYTVVLKSSDEPIGVCGLVNRETLPLPDLGFAFLPEYVGKGYAYEAAKATLEYARTNLKLSSVLAITLEDNARSILLLERLDFDVYSEHKDKSTDKNLMHYIYHL